MLYNKFYSSRVKSKSKICKRLAQPLVDEDYSNKLYQLPTELEEELRMIPKPLDVPSVEELKGFYNKLGNDSQVLPPII